MENSSNYSKDPDYQCRRGLEAAGGAEFQQRPAAPPPSYTSCHLDAGLPLATSLCNGTANGIREFPQHHGLLQQNQHHGTGEARLLGQSDAIAARWLPSVTSCWHLNRDLHLVADWSTHTMIRSFCFFSVMGSFSSWI